MNGIANSDLTEKQIPSPNAEWKDIIVFARSFDGYEYWGSFKECAEVANIGAMAWHEGRRLPNSLTDLRTCLFFEQRFWGSQDEFVPVPDEEPMIYIHALIEEIRCKVQKCESD